MLQRSNLRFSALFIGIGLSLSFLALHAQNDNDHARKYKAPSPAAHIEVTVLKDFNGKPIDNAHVIFHPTEGDKDTGALEVKTNDEGKAVIDVIPIGDTITLQVIVNGYQTYGQSYKIDKPELTMEVRMKRPGGQYSTYTNSDINVNKPRNSNGNSNAGSSGSSSSGAPNTTPPASGNKSSGSGNESSGNQSQPQPK